MSLFTWSRIVFQQMTENPWTSWCLRLSGLRVLLEAWLEDQDFVGQFLRRLVSSLQHSLLCVGCLCGNKHPKQYQASESVLDMHQGYTMILICPSACSS